MKCSSLVRRFLQLGFPDATSVNLAVEVELFTATSVVVVEVEYLAAVLAIVVKSVVEESPLVRSESTRASTKDIFFLLVAIFDDL